MRGRGDKTEGKRALAAANEGCEAGRVSCGGEERERGMAAAGQQAMTQEELNEALWHACGEDNYLLPRAAELLDRGAI